MKLTSRETATEPPRTRSGNPRHSIFMYADGQQYRRSDRENGPESVDTDAATAVFESAPVTVAVLYGSRSRGDHRRKSDVDFPVEFDQLLSEIERVV